MVMFTTQHFWNESFKGQLDPAVKPRDDVLG